MYLTRKLYLFILKKNIENRFYSNNCDISNYSYQNTKTPKIKAEIFSN